MARLGYAFCLSLSVLSPLLAGVPDRITYQGRVTKSGVSLAGAQTLVLKLYDAGSGAKLDERSFNVDLPGTGEFSLEWDDLRADIDWRTVQPELELWVNGEKLSPREKLSSTVYAFTARSVDAGGVDTAALKDGAVTDVKVSSGVSAGKIKLRSGEALSAWEHATVPGKIDGARVQGGVLPGAHGSTHRFGQSDAIPLAGLDPRQIAGTVLVANSTMTQTVQPTQNVTPLVVKGNPGGVATIPMLEVYGNEASPQKKFHVRADGQVYTTGRLGIGVTDPAAALDVVSPLNQGIRVSDGTRTGVIVPSGLGGLAMGTTSGHPLSLITGNAERVHVTADGKLGVGTNNPQQALHVAGRVRDRSGFVTPVGTIIAFAGSTPPEGWFECAGQQISRADYAELFAVIGTVFGGGNGSSTFNLPNLQGEFLRGWDHGRGVDTGRGFGSFQNHMFQEHYHTVHNTTHNKTPQNTDYTPGEYGDYVSNAGTTGWTGGSETRPRNVAVMYCIKH